MKINAVYNKDCVRGMHDISDGAVDLIITDPPFAIDFKARRGNYNRAADRVMDGYCEISASHYLDFTVSWMHEAFRVLKDTGNCFVFSGWNNLKDILIAADKCGFHTVNHIIWKYQFGVVCRKRFVTSHYHCLFLCKNEKNRKFYPNCRFNGEEKTSSGGSARYRDMEDVWVVNREYWTGDRKTPTKLPHDLIEKILAYTSKSGDLVLDPFLGSGQVAVVSKMHNRKYIGFEIVPEYCKFAQERLRKNLYRIKHSSISDSCSKSVSKGINSEKKLI